MPQIAGRKGPVPGANWTRQFVDDEFLLCSLESRACRVGNESLRLKLFIASETIGKSSSKFWLASTTLTLATTRQISF